MCWNIPCHYFCSGNVSHVSLAVQRFSPSGLWSPITEDLASRIPIASFVPGFFRHSSPDSVRAPRACRTALLLPSKAMHFEGFFTGQWSLVQPLSPHLNIYTISRASWYCLSEVGFYVMLHLSQRSLPCRVPAPCTRSAATMG